ncbi:MAG: hypothetical protein AAF530_18420 [Pseudomonadota bacterium]
MEKATQPHQFADDGSRLEDLQILVFVQSRGTRALLGTILGALRVHKVSWSDTLSDCMARIEQSPPDILIADSRSIRSSVNSEESATNAAPHHEYWPDELLPDGLKLLKWIRQDPAAAYAQTPVILLNNSDLTAERLIQAAQNAGAHDVLAKPLSMDALHGSLTQLIHRPPAFVRSDSYFGPDRRKTQRTSGDPERQQGAFRRRTDGIAETIAG